MTLHQVVLEHVYLGIFIRVVGRVAVDDRGRAVVLMLGRMGVEDIHGPFLFGLRGLCLVVLLLRLVLRAELVTLHTCMVAGT